ncbi:MAG: hypothetical protein JXR97_15060 [Planctomycetes bacterium]|nr:hypothetical protein [Planctomycetota bacterium]
MQTFELHLKSASQRMRNVRFIQILTRCMALSFLFMLFFVVLDKSGLAAGILHTDWSGTGVWRDGAWARPMLEVPPLYLHLFLITSGLSVLTAAAILSREDFSTRRAALALDMELGFEERLTSAAELGSSGYAMSAPLMEDASRHCSRIDLRKVFSFSGGKWTGRLAILVAFTLSALVFMPDLDPLGIRQEERNEKQAKAEDRDKAKGIAKALEDRSKKLRKEIEKDKTKREELAELTKRMEDLAKKIREDEKINSEKAKEMINRLTEEIKKKAEEDTESGKKMRSLVPPKDPNSPMKDTINRLRDNDFKGASDELKKLRRRLMRKKIDKEELKRLSKEMRDLAKQLGDKKLRKLQKSMEDMAKELEDLQNSKDLDKLNKLQEKLEQSLKNLQDGKQLDLSKLTDEEKELLKKLQESLSKMELTEKMLEEMQKAAEEGRSRMMTQEDLKKMLEQLKNQKFCPKCNNPGWDGIDRSGGKSGEENGTGDGKDGNAGGDGDGKCPVCGRDKNGNGNGNGNTGLMGVPMGGNGQKQQGNGGGKGQGMGNEGQGQGGKAPEKDGDADFQPDKIKARTISPGRIVGISFVRGMPPGEDKPKTEYTEEVEAVESSEESVREKELIPREDRELIRQYHNKIKGIEADK